MRTLIDINDDLLKEAMKMAGVRTKKETVQRALEEFIKLRLRQELKEMAGSGAIDMSHNELKKMRHKRDRLHESLSSKI
jgi:Arc/MetJ family transcription regulator